MDLACSRGLPGRREPEPIVVYMETGCESCSLWVEHLRTAGYEVEIGALQDLPSIRRRFPLRPGFRGRHTAVVDDLFVEGHVPTIDIATALRLTDRGHIVGFVVPGMPKGAPGVGTPVIGKFAFYFVYHSGFMRLLNLYNDYH